ncbi:MAG: TIGR01548 family HAD-type hydrolase [Cyanobium sp. NAT70]|nr:TIGR01548 family HAD-type hydrolase [Cyanobium sp. NAT70]
MSKLTLLFDIDGVIRDVAGSYRRALQETVHHYGGWRPDPSSIDALKAEGRWNNDWDASLEFLRRRGLPCPDRDALITVFSSFYFGGDPTGDHRSWTGFIGDEPLLVDPSFFTALTTYGCRWGFVSGAEPPSARFVLTQRLGLVNPPLIAMGDAPDKPDPKGLILLSDQLVADSTSAVAYLGDTVADVQTVLNARQQCPQRTWISLGVPPPHVQASKDARLRYDKQLRDAGADHILSQTSDLIGWIANNVGTES